MARHGEPNGGVKVCQSHGTAKQSSLGYTFRYYPGTSTYLATKERSVIVHNGANWNMRDANCMDHFLSALVPIWPSVKLLSPEFSDRTARSFCSVPTLPLTNSIDFDADFPDQLAVLVIICTDALAKFLRRCDPRL